MKKNVKSIKICSFLIAFVVIVLGMLSLTKNIAKAGSVADKLAVDVNITSGWESGGSYNYIFEILCTNTSDTLLSNWRVDVEFPEEVDVISCWNGKYSKTGSVIAVTPESYNTTIDKDEQVNIGLYVNSDIKLSESSLKISNIDEETAATAIPTTQAPTATIESSTNPIQTVSPTVAPTQTSGNNDETCIEAVEENVKLIGRTHYYNDALWLALSASGIEFEFTGKKAEVVLVGDNMADLSIGTGHFARFAIYVDDELIVDDFMKSKEQSYEIINSDVEKSATIKIIKLTEAPDSTMGIKGLYVDGNVTPAKEKQHKIEFIGDSITCGFGVDDINQYGQYTSETEDGSKTYAYQTAQNLNADYSMVCYSGYGIISGYTSDGTINSNQLVSKYYDKVGFSYGYFDCTLEVASVNWSFDRFVPDLVVINLGTNDNSYCNGNAERGEEFTVGYVEFLKMVREKNPSATILCTLGTMGDELYPNVADAVSRYTTETGDTNVFSMKFDVQQYNDGYGACWHPSLTTHTKAATKLTAYIKELMNW